MRKGSSAPGVESAWPTTNVRRATPKLSQIILNNENRCRTSVILFRYFWVSHYLLRCWVILRKFRFISRCQQLSYDDFFPPSRWRTHASITRGLLVRSRAFYSLERIHSEGDVHAWAVREEGSQGGLLKQSKDQDLVPETHRGKHLDFEITKPQTQKNDWK